MVNQVIDSVFAEDNIEVVGKVIKAGLERLSGLYEQTCSGDKSGAELAYGLYSLLEDFMAVSPDVERTVLDAVPFLLPGKPVVTKANIKEALNFLFTSGLVPVAQICDAFTEEEEEEESMVEMAPVEEEEEEELVGCDAPDPASLHSTSNAFRGHETFIVTLGCSWLGTSEVPYRQTSTIKYRCC